MGQIHVAVKSSASVEKLFKLARSAYNYVYAMPNVKEIIVVESSDCGTRNTAEWVLAVPLPGEYGRLAWMKTAVWDDTARTCSLSLSPLYEGVVKKLDGFWEFLETPRGSLMKLTMEFNIVHPMVSPFVHKLFDGLIKKNNEALLNEIKKLAERA